jgi:hypothetical protein
MAKKAVPKHQDGRRKRRVNLTLDRDTLARLERLIEREELGSLSHAVRWLAKADATK